MVFFVRAVNGIIFYKSTYLPEDPGYGEANITIINVQSYPSIGGNWTVRFNTTGTANLTITVVDGTTWNNANEDYQLKFLELRCGNTTLNYTWINNSVFIKDYECNETGSETSKVIRPGEHTLEFTFGEDKDYAFNTFTLLGEAGSVNISDGTWQLVSFNNVYSTSPVVIATITTLNEPSTYDESPIIPTINMVNETHFNITLCIDNGTAACTAVTAEEEVHYFVFDMQYNDTYGWIKFGRRTGVTTAGADTAVTFNTMDGTPKVFATAQTYSQEGNLSMLLWVDDMTTTSVNLQGCVHLGIADACTAGPTETVGWVALDPTNQNITDLQTGTEENTGSGMWNSISFSPSFTEPRIMVTNNEDDGAQDPKTPMAVNVTTSGAEIRFCEQDYEDYCDGHNTNTLAWFAVEDGDIYIGTAPVSSVLQCTFIQNTTCPLGTARLIGAENDTEGYNNAHAQNNSFETYNYSLCCNHTNASINITSGCPGNATVINLNSSSNSHVEIGTNSNYSIPICLSSDWKYVICTFPTGSCPSNYTCVLSMAGSEGTNSSNAHVANCSEYNQKVCCKLENKAPTQPTLYYPADGNYSVFERKPNFNWSISTDPDGDNVDYTLNITCESCSAICEVHLSSISTTNYTVSNALCVDTHYNWTVSACDDYDLCNTSVIFDFNITSQAILELIINTTDFGEMANNENNDTTDDSPTPLVARNIGNVLLNVTINATALFDSVAMNTVYYQFKADENETDSYDGDCSQNATFANMSTSPKNIFCNLSYEDVNDEGEIELNITIPSNEGGGAKSSTMKVSPFSTE